MDSQKQKYAPVPAGDEGEGGELRFSPPRRHGQRRLIAALSFLTVTFMLSTIVLALQQPSSTISPYTGLSRTRVSRLEGYRRPEYTSANMTLADEAWSAANLGHGIVALDAWHAVEELGLPPSRPWKPDSSKAIYAVAAYHAMHCVPYLRRLIQDSYGGETLSSDQYHHALHCMEILREEVMCTADDVLLTMPMVDDGKRRPVGYQQTRQCTDWAPLRDWATENSAGYLTYEDHPGVPHWGVSFPDTDGWLVD